MKPRKLSRLTILFIIFTASCYCDSIELEPTRPVKASAIQYKQKDILISGFRIRYIDEGSGPTLLLLHGHQSRIEEFSKIIPHFIRDFRIIAFDMPGSGYSSKPNIKYSLEMYEDMAIQFLDKMKVDKAIIVGGSMGANIALRIGRNHPDRVNKLAIWSPAGVWDKHYLLAWMAENFYNTRMHCFIVKLQSRYWYSDNFKNKDRALADVFDYISEVDSLGFRAATADIASQQLLDIHLGKGYLNRNQILLMVGDLDDGLDLFNKSKKFFLELPNVKFIVIKNSGHAILAEKPMFLEYHLKKFLADDIKNIR